MNKVTLIGRAAKDPELKYTPGAGTAVTTLTIAVNNYNSKEKKNEADFIPVVIWGKQAENAAQYIVKGSQVAISGRISVRTYDAKDGTKRYVTEVVADMYQGVEFLSKATAAGNTTTNNTSSWDGTEVPIDDGDMPF